MRADDDARVPRERLVRRVVGLLLVALGVALTAVATGPTAQVGGLAAVGVLTVGGTCLVRGVRGWPREGRRLAAGRVLAGTVLVAVAVTALAWRDASVRALAVLLAAGLVVHGVVTAVGRGDEVGGGPGRGASERAARVLLGAASGVLGVVVLAWPRLSLHVVALVVGAWLVLEGLASVVRGAARSRQPRRGLVGAVAAVTVAGLLLAGTAWVYAGDPRVVPDAFYTPPASVPDEPGRLIRVRPLRTGVPEGLRAWLILYTTTDGDGAPAVASGTVLAPEGSGEVLPVIAVGHGTTGIVPRCAPSLSETPFADGAGAALEEAVRAGRAAVVSDYVGLGTAGPHAYLVGPDAAHAVLDAVRAARELDDVRLGTDVVAWGHSQGGHAALWTGILAEEYAPELDLLGVAAFAPASDLYALADDLRTEAIGKLVGAYIGASWDRAFPELDVRGQMTPTYRRDVDRIADLCFTGRDVVAALATATQLSGEVFVPGALDGPLGDRLRAESPTGRIDVPVLLAQGDADPLVLPARQAEYVAARCAEGVTLDARVYPGLDHLTLVAAESPLTADLLVWTDARFAGDPAEASCAS